MYSKIPVSHNSLNFPSERETETEGNPDLLQLTGG